MVFFIYCIANPDTKNPPFSVIIKQNIAQHADLRPAAQGKTLHQADDGRIPVVKCVATGKQLSWAAKRRALPLLINVCSTSYFQTVWVFFCRCRMMLI